MHTPVTVLFVPLEDLVHEVLEGAGDLLLGKGDDLVDDLRAASSLVPVISMIFFNNSSIQSSFVR